VAKASRKRSYKRGHPVATLLGLEENRAVLWQVFSNVVKPRDTVALSGARKDGGALYNFHEAVMDSLRSMLKEGVRSIVLASPLRADYATEFLDHVQRHHAYMTQTDGPNAVAFGMLVGHATQLHEVAELVKTSSFRKLITETTSDEADHIIATLEKRLNDTNRDAAILFSIKEIELLVYSQWKHGGIRPEYLMLTNKYLAESKEKNRLQRLLQISKNKNVKTRVINAETPAGKRLSQLGGLVCFSEPS
jgi:stalled ribosome rescue protein Dom34